MSRHLRMYFYIFTTRNVRVQICRNTKTKTIIPIIIFLHGNNYWNNVRCEIMSMKRERLAETAPSFGTLQKRAPRANCDKSAHRAPAKVPRDRFVRNFVEIATRRCLDALQRTTAELRAIFRRALRNCKYRYLFTFGLSTESTFCFTE